MTTLSPSALAKATGVSPDTLRHYERKGLLMPQRNISGYRRYPPESVGRVRLIRRAMIIGFSLTELARVLSERDHGRVPCHSVRTSIEAHLSELEQKLKELHALKRDLRSLLRDWDKKLARTPAGKQARLLDQLTDEDTFAGIDRNRSKPVGA